MDNNDYSALNAQASNYRTIVRFLIASGINEFLAVRKLLPIDLKNCPQDTTGGNSVILFLKSLADECREMNGKITELSTALVDSQVALSKNKNKPVLQRLGIFK